MGGGGVGGGQRLSFVVIGNSGGVSGTVVLRRVARSVCVGTAKVGLGPEGRVRLGLL